MGLKETLAHIATGLLCGLLSLLNPVGSVLLFLSFIAYEFNEEKNIQVSGDPAYQEIFEFMFGMVCGVVWLVIYG